MNVNAAGLKDIFSANYYADSYEDLYAAFEYNEAKLFKHVKEYGLKEKRDVSPILDVVYYRETYPDLNAAFGDNWDLYVNHYFEYGIKEGRDNGTDFDVIRYVNSYADLRQAFGDDYEALAKHYIQYGIKENRTMALKVKAVSGATSSAAPAPTTYEEITYDEDGRISKVEVYSDSSKTTLVSYQEYEYYDVSGYAIYTYDAQGNLTYAVLCDANDIIRSKVIVEEYDAENGLVISGSIFNYYENGNMKSERVTVDEQLVKEVSYYENGIIEEYYECDPATGMEISGYGYYQNGQMRFQFGFDENGDYYEKEWDHHGTLRYHSGHDEDGYFTKEWDENGNLITEDRGE